jgi:hypothetical protein
MISNALMTAGLRHPRLLAARGEIEEKAGLAAERGDLMRGSGGSVNVSAAMSPKLFYVLQPHGWLRAVSLHGSVVHRR